MNIKDVMKQAHETAVANGFWDPPLDVPTSVALFHSEASEILEAHRNNEGADRIIEECADLIIRVFDFAEGHELDLEQALIHKMEYNKGRPRKHGKRY